MELLILGLIIVVINISIILFINFLSKNKIFRYSIAILLLIATVYYFFKPDKKEGFSDLANFLMMLICFLSFITSLTTSVILDYKKTKRQ